MYINNIPDIESCISQIQLINNYYHIELSYSGKEDDAFSNISKELMKCFVKIFSAEHSNARLFFNRINMKNLNSLETYLNDLINLISREGKNNVKSALIIFLKKYDKPLKFSNTNRKDLQYNEFINKNQYLNLNKSISDIRRLMNLDSKTQKSLFIKIKQQIPLSIKDFMQLLIYLTKEIKKLDDELKDIINEYYE